MEGLLETQNQIMTGMDQLLRNFKKDSHDRKTPDYVRRKLETLDTYWNEFHSNHIQICSFGDKNNTYFTGMEYERTNEFYNQARQVVQGYLNETSRPSTPIIKPSTLNLPTNLPSSPMAPPRKSEFNSSKLDELLRIQASNFKAFSRTTVNINIDTLDNKWEYEDALKMLQSRWNIIDTLHWEIDSEQKDESDRNYEAYETEFVKYEKSFTAIKRAINTKMWSVSHREKSTPQMEIPTFSGNYQQWTSFKDLFEASIHNNPSLSSAQKLQFLKSKLKGDADKLIQHLNVSTENYQISWDILNHRFNNKKLIFTSHVTTLLSLPVMQTQTAALIKKLHDTTNECLHAIQKMGVDTSTWDPIIVHLLAQKLDVDSHNDYVESLKNPRELPTIKEFLNFLETKFTALESFRRKQESTKPSSSVDYRLKKSYYQNSINHQANKFTKPLPLYKTMHVETKRCPHCNENHAIYLCKSFRESRTDVKQKTIAKNNLCKNCLFDHHGKECLSNKTCRHCNDKHNSLIHDIFVSSTENSTTNKIKQSNDRNTCHVSQKGIAETLLATAMVKVMAADGGHHTMRALIDQGSQTSLITENAAQRLRITRQRCKGVIFGVGAKENNCKGAIRITLSSLHNNFSTSTDAFIMKSIINKLPNQSFEKPSWKYIDTIELADPEFYVSKQVDILLGADVYSSIIMSGIIKIGPSYPVAQETQLGWILCGNVQTFHCNVIINQTDELQRFWEIEDITQTPSDLSESDDRCIKYYQATTLRDKGGRYHVRIPFKPNYEAQLGTSKPMAVAQFHQLERKFSKSKLIAKDYKLFIDEYRSLGHMIPVDDGNTKLNCYLPHHGVRRSESTTTALRVVFNASAKTSTGLSLNDVMEVGPNLQQDLQCLILKWRKYQYAFVADIEKMFRQIGVQEKDQRYQKIIWRDSPEHPLQVYQLTTVTYGTKSAPFLAMMTLKQLAIDEQHNYQKTNATKVLEESFYMDDLLHGSYTITEGKLLKEDLVKLLKSGGFNLRKWKSNAVELLSDRNQTNQECFDFKQNESTKTLGIRWQPQTDLFIFDCKLNFKDNYPTKRILLSDISKIFDPLGWLSPLTTKLKLLFQKLWQLQLEWDEHLPKEICGEWTRLKEDLHNVGYLQLPRWLGTKKQDTIELHGFCDASTKAYAAVIYCKIGTGESASVVLVAGKARLVPASKTITLPKLELCGAVLLAKLMQKIKECYAECEIKSYGWIDSMVVLGWLNGEPSRWKPFVANRVRQAIVNIPPKSWQYIKSEENPADCASRGMNASQTKQHQLWWKGPHWLPYYNDKSHNQDLKYTTDEEIKIPLVSRDLFDIYKIITTPREVDNYMVTLLPIASHVAINLQKDLYVPISDNTLQMCMSYDVDVHLCPLQSPLYQFKSDQCLCVKDTNRETCKTKTIPCEHSWSQLHKMNSFLYTCCGECPVRIICDQLIAAERLRKAGVITLGDGCVIKGDSFTITSHKQFYNNIHVRPDIVTPDIPPINNIINVAIPNTTIEFESNGLEKDLKIIGDQIKEIKSKEGIADVVSYHDVHHYVAIYMFVAVAVLGGLSWLCLRRRRARRQARAGSDVDATYSASVQCVSVKESAPSEQCNSLSVNMAKMPGVSARIDKATMPDFRKHFQASD